VLDALGQLQPGEPDRERPDEEQPRLRPPLAQPLERRDQLCNPLALVQVAKAAVERVAADGCGPELGDRPGGMRDPDDRAAEPALPRTLLDVP
jgi:hypothetical protein